MWSLALAAGLPVNCLAEQRAESGFQATLSPDPEQLSRHYHPKP